MSTLVVIEYDDQYKAEEVRLKLRKMQKDYLIDMEDAVVAVKDDRGKIKLTLKINQLDLSRIVATLERFGYRVIGRYQEAPHDDDSKERLDMLMKYLNI